MILGRSLRWHAQEGLKSDDPLLKHMMLECVLEILDHSREVTEKRTESDYMKNRFTVTNHKARIVLDGE